MANNLRRCRTKLLGQPLSPRELETMRWLIEGHSNKQIADYMNISNHTAKFHVETAMMKLGAKSRVKAAVDFVLSPYATKSRNAALGASTPNRNLPGSVVSSA